MNVTKWTPGVTDGVHRGMGVIDAGQYGGLER
jgi:hypothetical protein